jgi:hypothetical protein
LRCVNKIVPFERIGIKTLARFLLVDDDDDDEISLSMGVPTNASLSSASTNSMLAPVCALLDNTKHGSNPTQTCAQINEKQPHHESFPSSSPHPNKTKNSALLTRRRGRKSTKKKNVQVQSIVTHGAKDQWPGTAIFPPHRIVVGF